MKHSKNALRKHEGFGQAERLKHQRGDGVGGEMHNAVNYNTRHSSESWNDAAVESQTETAARKLPFSSVIK